MKRDKGGNMKTRVKTKSATRKIIISLEDKNGFLYFVSWKKCYVKITRAEEQERRWKKKVVNVIER